MKDIKWLFIFFVCMSANLDAYPKEAWIKKHLETEYDFIVWGCMIKHCSQNSAEAKQRWKSVAYLVPLVEKFDIWFEKEGKRIQTDWRNGTVKYEDEKYLPLVKTVFWDTGLHNWGSRYFRYKRFSKATCPEEEEYQAVLEAGLPVLHKIYNGKPLTNEDKSVFQDWLIAYYCDNFIGGIDPKSLPGDSWKIFEVNLLGLDANFKKCVRYKPGDRVENFQMMKPEKIWEQPGFDPHNIFNLSWHLRQERLDDIIATYSRLAEAYEPSETYPFIKYKTISPDTPDSESDFTFYNYLQRERKPLIFSNILINKDESNRRIMRFLPLYFHAWGEYLNLLVAEMGTHTLIEKNNLYFNMEEEQRVICLLDENIGFPCMPVPFLSHDQNVKWAEGRFAVLNPDGVVLTYQRHQMKNKKVREKPDFTAVPDLNGIIGMDAYLIECFKAGFSREMAQNKFPWGPVASQYGKSVALAESNGYDRNDYNPYAKMYQVIGEVIDVNSLAHTFTVLRGEFCESDYPQLAVMKKFDISPEKSVELQMKLFQRYGKEGNSPEVRAWTFKVNSAVFTFVDGKEVKDETGFAKGDIVSVMIGGDPHVDAKQVERFPYLIRGLRYKPTKQSE